MRPSPTLPVTSLRALQPGRSCDSMTDSCQSRWEGGVIPLGLLLCDVLWYANMAWVGLWHEHDVVKQLKLDSLRWFSQRRSRTPHFGGSHPGAAMTSKFELGRDFCTVQLPLKFHHPMFTCSEVIVLTNTQTDAAKTPNALRYATLQRLVTRTKYTDEHRKWWVRLWSLYSTITEGRLAVANISCSYLLRRGYATGKTSLADPGPGVI